MTDNTPTSNERILLDVIGNVPAEWDLDVTYPTLPDVTHQFPSLPELVLTTVDGNEIAVRAVITDDRVFHGYVVTTTYPETAILTPECRERRLTSLSHRELLSKGVTLTHHPDTHPASETAVSQSLSLSAAASLAVYYVATVGTNAAAGDDHAHETLPTADD